MYLNTASTIEKLEETSLNKLQEKLFQLPTSTKASLLSFKTMAYMLLDKMIQSSNLWLNHTAKLIS